MNISKIRLVLITLIFTSPFFSGKLLANPNKGGHNKPPKEAVEACIDKNEGDVVTFTTRHGHELTGVCTILEEVFVAVPENHPSREEKQNN